MGQDGLAVIKNESPAEQALEQARRAAGFLARAL